MNPKEFEVSLTEAEIEIIITGIEAEYSERCTENNKHMWNEELALRDKMRRLIDEPEGI